MSKTKWNPYASLSENEKLSKRKALFLSIVQREKDFVAELDYYISAVIAPILLRDTNFKRSIMNEPAVAISFNLLKDIFTACARFLQEIRASNSATKMSNAYKQFAPSLQLFSQFASENVGCLNTMKVFSKSLDTFAANIPFPDGMSIQSTLVIPLRHYQNYCADLQVRLCV